MESPAEKLTIHTSYNLSALSFSAEQLVNEIQGHLPLEVTYSPDHRQKIADSWPQSIDDSSAQQDWGWKPEFDLSKMVEVMLTKLKEKIKIS